MRARLVLLLVATAALGALAVAVCPKPRVPAQADRTLRRASDVRALSPAEARRGHPVLLTGIVTAYEPTLQVLTVQDETGGVLVDLLPKRITRGERVELSGFTGFEAGHRLIVRPTLRIVGEEDPGPARRAAADDVLAGREDDQWVEVDGVLHEIEHGGDGGLVLRLSLAGQPVRGVAKDAGNALSEYRGRPVRVSGVVNTVYGPDGRPARTDLILPGEPVIRDAAGREPRPPSPPPGAAEPLTKVSQVRALSPGEAALPRRVHLEGTITFIDPRRYLVFLADETGSIYLSLVDGAGASLRPGSRVALDGLTQPGAFAPIVDYYQWRATGSGPLPAARPIGSEDLSDPFLDAQWVELEGTVRGVRRFARDNVEVRLRVGERPLDVLIPGFEGRPLPELLPDARVRVRGVLGSQFDGGRRFRGFRLLSPSLAHLQTLSPGVREPFAVPERPLGTLLKFQPGPRAPLARVAGTVVLRRADGRFYVSDASGGSLVEPLGETDVAEGEGVEVVGHLSSEAAPVLEDALVRRSVARGVPSRPTEITAEQGVGPEWDARLVRVDAHLVDARSSRGEHFLLLESGRVRFLASLDAPQAGGLVTGLEPGSLLGITGVHALRPRQTFGGDTRLFELLLRSPADVVVLHPAPWWTPRRILGLLGGVSAVALLAFGWVIVLRRRVEAQTQEIRRKLEERAALEDRLRESGRLESLGRLAGGVAHNFNNLLMMIGGSTELARRRTAPDHPAYARLASIDAAVARAASLTSQLLAFGRRQLLSPRVLDVNALLREAVDTLQPLVGAGIAVLTKLDPRAGAVLADPGHLDQIFFNLAANARDAMPGGGTLLLESSRLAPVANPGAPGGRVRIAFRDDGEGMSEEARRCAFEPFFSTKPPGKGNGLGLASVHGLLQQSGGRVAIESAPGRGTSVLVDLPWVGTSAAVPPAVVTAAEPTRARPSVLLVEDEPEIRELLAAALTDAGCDVVQAESGRQAVEWLGRLTSGLDVLVTDVVMRPPDGREVARAARALRPGLPVVFASGFAEGRLFEEDTAAPGTLFLQKPFPPARLVSAVRALVSPPRGV